MTDTATTEAVANVAKEIGKFAVKSAAQTAVEVTAATAILLATGYVYNVVQTRRAKKAAPKIQAV